MRLLDEGIRQTPGIEHAEAFPVLRIVKDDYQWPGVEWGVNGPKARTA